MSQTTSDQNQRKVLLQHAYNLHERFPKEYSKIKLLVAKAGGGGIDDEDFRYSLGKIVDGYNFRTAKQAYFRSIRGLISKLDDLASLVEDAVSSLSQLDLMHINLLVETLYRFPMVDSEKIGWHETFEDFSMFHFKLVRLLAAIKLVVSPEVRLEGRSRPLLPFVRPTAELIKLWEDLTHTRVASPRGLALAKDGTKEATQPAAEFVRLGLRMIDPKVTVENAITSIRNVQQAHRKEANAARAWATTNDKNVAIKDLRKRIRQI